MKITMRSDKERRLFRRKKTLRKLMLGLVLCVLISFFHPLNLSVYAVTNGFNIDAGHLYPNMDMTYQEGYVPTVSDGKVRIVLPLIHTGSEYVENAMITATIDYGTLSDSPFIIKQYQKKFPVKTFTFEEEKLEVYPVEFELDLKDDRINGIYPIMVKIQYNSYDVTTESFNYTTKEQQFPVYITISDGKDGNEAPEEPDKNVNIRMVSSSINPELIYPGDDFLVQVDLKNTGAKDDIKNVKIRYENAEGVLIPRNHTGTIYLDEIPAGITKKVTMELAAAKHITNLWQKIFVSITYEDREGNEFNETEYIYITLCPSPIEEPESQLPNFLELDTKHTFSGMMNSYETGYEPLINKNKATIVLPLILRGDGSINHQEITASVGLSESLKEAFFFKNYEKKFKLSQSTTKEGEKVSVYLVKFSLDLMKNRWNGVYPVTVNIKYQSGSEWKEQNFSLYIEIKDGKDPGEKEEEVETPIEFPPKLIIESCEINPFDAQTGDVITFRVTLHNTGIASSIRDFVIKYSSESNDLLPLNSNTSIFVDRIAAGATKEITFQMKAAGEVSSTIQKVLLNMEGLDDKASPIIASESLYLTLSRPMGIQVDKPNMKTEVESGKTETVKVPVFNTGSTKLKNVMCALHLPGVLPSGTVFLGDIEPGASAEAEIEAIIANKMTTDSSINESDKYGLVVGFVTVSYEDEEGNSYQKEVEIKTKIIPSSGQAEEPEGISVQWWISIIVGLVVMQLIVMGILLYRKKRVVYA
ncbi:MAG: hypothetical protein K0S76_1555 [Herbinix sp.]|jgi:hypothetical protein|nr:hypothetical protein [Herbinix sp.]